MGSQSSVPRDPNGLFLLAQKWLILFAYEALIKMFVDAAYRCNGRRLDIQRPDKINFALPEVFSSKIICHHFYITIIHKSSFFNCNIIGSPYVEILLINMTKLLFLFFLRDCNVPYCFLQFLDAVTASAFHTQKYFNWS